jgi:hypothetical protein
MKTRTAQDLARGELIAKDMSTLREQDSAYTEHKQTRGMLRDYSLQHRVEINWGGLNVEATRDRVFQLTVDDKTVLLDAEQVMRYLRWL